MPDLRALAARLRRTRNRPRRDALAALAILSTLLFICLYPAVKAHLQAAAVLDQVAGTPVPRLLRPFAGDAVTVTEVQVPLPNAPPLRARLYTPANHPGAPAMVVLHGVHHRGMDEPRLIAFARAMASTGLRILTPELPGIADYHVSPASTEAIGTSAQWLAQQQAALEAHNGHAQSASAPAQVPVGVMGLSFSGGLALLAAADPRYNSSIRFVVAIGSQGAMSRVATYYRTGTDARPTGPAQTLTPHEYGALVLEYQNLQDFVPAADIPALHAVLRAHLYEDAPAEKAAFAALTPAQHAEAMQLLDTASPTTRALLEANQNRHLAEMDQISPTGHLRTLRTPVYLLHGAGDNIIPAAETLWMASELPNESLRALLISPVLSHLNLDGAQPTLTDRLRLVHFFAQILRNAHQPWPQHQPGWPSS